MQTRRLSRAWAVLKQASSGNQGSCFAGAGGAAETAATITIPVAIVVVVVTVISSTAGIVCDNLCLWLLGLAPFFLKGGPIGFALELVLVPLGDMLLIDDPEREMLQNRQHRFAARRHAAACATTFGNVGCENTP